jgi:diadenosine tetraphosphatase ApaH/serine/threonine PP2A family protein phosphatase
MRNRLYDWIELGFSEPTLINCGSVGQPRDGDCRASYGLLEISEGYAPWFRLRRVAYNIGIMEMSIVDAGLPSCLAERLYKGY